MMIAKKLVMKRLLRGQAAKTVLEVLVITFPFSALILHDERLCSPGVFTMIQVVAERTAAVQFSSFYSSHDKWFLVKLPL